VIFVDTWAWLALAHRHDPYHGVAVQQHRAFQKQKARYVTTDYVLAEFMTPLFAVLDFAKARRFVETVFQAIQTGRFQLVQVSPIHFEGAWQLRLRYHDKPRISFVDLTSMVVMQDLGVVDIFTGDAHFQQANLGFRLHP
jgi:predicted nucleic acid-binding protein